MRNRLLKRPEVEELTGLSRSSIYLRMKRGDFPVPVRISSNSVAWRQSDIDEWIKSLPLATHDESRAAAG